jgi:hypothetical protein
MAPPWRALGAVQAGGGLGRACGAVGWMVFIRFSFPVKMGGLPVGVAVRCLVPALVRFE